MTKMRIINFKIQDGVLEELENKLDLSEKVSLVFLLYDSAPVALERLMSCSNVKSTLLAEWYLKEKQVHRIEMLAEALVLIGNLSAFRILGIHPLDARMYFKSNNYLNRRKVALYKVAESLNKVHTERLIESMPRSLEIDPYSITSCKYLEVHYLYWIQEGIIKIDKDGGLDSLKKVLKGLNKDLVGLLEFEDEKAQVKATEPVEKEVLSPGYKIFNKNNVGLCIIININEFSGQLKARAGSQEDCVALYNTMTGFNIRTQIFDRKLDANDIGPQIQKLVNTYFEEDHSVLFLVLMSHGSEGKIYGSDEKSVFVSELVEVLGDSSCPRLSGKPKVVIVQACQGENFMVAPMPKPRTVQGHEPNSDTSLEPSSPLTKPCFRTVVTDKVIYWSTSPGFVSGRDPSTGTWFIQKLCEVLNDVRKQGLRLGLSAIAHEVNSRLITNPFSYNKLEHPVTVLPKYESYLTHEIYLTNF